jgi:serine/threonine protein kinase
MNRNTSTEFSQQKATNDTQSLIRRLRVMGQKEVPATLLATLQTRLELEKQAAQDANSEASPDPTSQPLLPSPENALTNSIRLTRRFEQSQESRLVSRQEETSGHPSVPQAVGIGLKDKLPDTEHRVGNYRLLKHLGSGAFADIYLAEHCYLRTRAAVKVLRQRLTQEERECFLKEARITARMVHPLVVRVLDFNVERGIPYFVMDYTAYGSVRDHHPIGEPLEPADILAYASDIAEALEYIHSQQYIHQDLKPENLLFGRDRRVMISDFGIAIAVQETKSGKKRKPCGTPPYMAPEQIAGKPCTASDQYALGVMIYEWICGELPFDEEAENLAWLHINASPPSLCAQVPGLPKAVEQVVMRALAKDPRRRFPSVIEFVAQLEEAWDDVPLPRERVSFYNQTTYDIDPLVEIPKFALLAQKAAREKSKNKQRKKMTWKTVAFIFLLNFLLSILALICINGSNWSLLLMMMAAVIVGLPLFLGLVLKDRHFLMLGGLHLGLGVIILWISHGPIVFVGASIAESILCAVFAFNLYLYQRGESYNL